MKIIRRVLAGCLAIVIMTFGGYGSYAAVQSQSIPTQSYNLISYGDYISSAYTNGYRLYTNYYFDAHPNRCHFYGTSSYATSGYYIGIINYNTGYTYLNYRGAGTTSYDIWVDVYDASTIPIGSRYYCGFNMTSNSSAASNNFGVGSW